jgi:hypothetical protein
MMAPMPDDNKMSADLAVGELPRPDDERQYEADQEVVEEFQHVAEDGGEHDAPLVSGQPLLLVEEL